MNFTWATLSTILFPRTWGSPSPSLSCPHLMPVNPRNAVTLKTCLSMVVNSRIILSGRNFSVEHLTPASSLQSQMTRRIWKHLRALGSVPLLPGPWSLHLDSSLERAFPTKSQQLGQHQQTYSITSNNRTQALQKLVLIEPLNIPMK